MARERRCTDNTGRTCAPRGRADAPFADGRRYQHAGGTSNSAFATEVLARVCAGGAVAVWAFGHTHWNCDFERAGVRVVANQRGYRDGESGFDAARVLEMYAIRAYLAYFKSHELFRRKSAKSSLWRSLFRQVKKRRRG
jgi:hypothetical protein